MNQGNRVPSDSPVGLDQRHQASSAAMGQTSEFVSEMSKHKDDYNINSTYETASGTTDISIKRNNNTVIIVVSIVIGVIILAILS